MWNKGIDIFRDVIREVLGVLKGSFRVRRGVWKWIVEVQERVIFKLLVYKSLWIIRQRRKC